MSETEQLKGWKEIPIGGLILAPGNAREYKTGGWRTFKPVHHMDKCIHCLQCWMHCPDSAIKVEGGKFIAFNYDACKGCGICAKICPKKVQAITMEKEEK
ncbi:MAG: 4Fe-4S binding protein [Candidatus Omnitrophica bacterium]|nr:4Fe-4S binding protein [Candidatus Omnitrophota bacterium]